MGDYYHGCAPVPSKDHQQFDEFIPCHPVELARRLVGEYELRVVDKGTGDADALLLAPGELARMMAEAMGQADGGEGCLGSAPALAGWGASVEVLEREGNVLESREVFDEVEALEHKAHVVESELGEPGLGC